MKRMLVGLSDQDFRAVDAMSAASKIKLSDAIIWATAQCGQRLLITRNSKDLSPSALGVRVPYIL
jgi:hypothetical protein